MSKKTPLEKITLKGYKSIQELKDFPLGKGLNVFIGANGVGKSNFIRFFELLENIADPNKGLQNYISEHGGPDAFLFRGMKTTPELAASLVFGRNRYSFVLRPSNNRKNFFFSHESAPFDGPRYGTTINDQGSGHEESKLFRQPAHGTSSEDYARDSIRSWRVYHFHDTSPSAPVMGLCNIVDNEILHGNAANLAAFLLRISQSYPEHFARIEETVKQVAPFWGTLTLRDLGQGQTQLLWKDRFSDLQFYPHQLSDGTLRYLCLATVLLQPDPGATLIIDEPELGLHPYAIKLLASLLKEASLRTQIIVSTQSSLLIDELDPGQVVVVDHHDGETQFQRQDPNRLRDWLTEYTLGQLWEKDQLGGIP